MSPPHFTGLLSIVVIRTHIAISARSSFDYQVSDSEMNSWDWLCIEDPDKYSTMCQDQSDWDEATPQEQRWGVNSPQSDFSQNVATRVCKDGEYVVFHVLISFALENQRLREMSDR